MQVGNIYLNNYKYIYLKKYILEFQKKYGFNYEFRVMSPHPHVWLQ